MGLAQRITKKMPKDDIWQEILDRTKTDDCNFTDSEVKIIRFYFWGKPEKHRKIKDRRIMVTGRVVKIFKNVAECRDYFGFKTSRYISKLCDEEAMPTKGSARGCRFKWW